MIAYSGSVEWRFVMSTLDDHSVGICSQPIDLPFEGNPIAL